MRGDSSQEGNIVDTGTRQEENPDRGRANWARLRFPTSAINSVTSPATHMHAMGNASLPAKGDKITTRPVGPTAARTRGTHAWGSCRRLSLLEKRWNRRFGGKPWGRFLGSHDAAGYQGGGGVATPVPATGKISPRSTRCLVLERGGVL